MPQDRAEQHPGSPGDQVEEGELHRHHRQPLAGSELRPALGHVLPQAPASGRRRSRGRRSRGRRCGHRQQAEREHARGVGRRVHGHYHGRPGQGDQDPAEHGPADPGRRAGQPVQRVGVAELVLGRDLDGQRVLGRTEERLAGAHEPGQQDEEPERGLAREQRHRERGLRSAAERVGGDHHPAATQPVGDGTRERQRQHLRYDVRGEHEPQAGRASPVVEHGPGDRHGRHRRPEQGRHIAGVKPAEVRHRQHPGPAAHPLSPHDSGS